MSQVAAEEMVEALAMAVGYAAVVAAVAVTAAVTVAMAVTVAAIPVRTALRRGKICINGCRMGTVVDVYGYEGCPCAQI